MTYVVVYFAEHFCTFIIFVWGIPPLLKRNEHKCHDTLYYIVVEHSVLLIFNFGIMPAEDEILTPL